MANFDFSLVLGRKNLVEENETEREETFEEFKSRIDKMVEEHNKRMKILDELEERLKTKDETDS